MRVERRPGSPERHTAKVFTAKVQIGYARLSCIFYSILFSFSCVCVCVGTHARAHICSVSGAYMVEERTDSHRCPPTSMYARVLHECTRIK